MIAGAYDWTDDMLKIKSMQKKFRDSFNGTEINPARWEIAATGGGITHTVADGAVGTSSHPMACRQMSARASAFICLTERRSRVASSACSLRRR